MKTPAPLRNYQQMVRVVRDNQSHACCRLPYQLARAYGDGNASPTETRLRSLDEIGIDARSQRQPEPAANNNFVSTRETTTLYHQLDDQQQSYFRGINPDPAPTRQSAWPGTKSRAYLGGGSQESVNIQPPGEQQNTDRPQQSAEPNSEQFVSQPPQHLPADLSYQPSALRPGKQTRLPLVDTPSLKGIKGTDITF